MPMDESRMKAAFNLFDRDGDGKISFDELREVFKTLNKGATDSELREMIGGGSVEGLFTARGGAIDYETFKLLFDGELRQTNKDGPGEITDLQEAFRLLDMNKQGQHLGYITCDKLQLICAKLGEKLTVEEAEAMVNEALIGFQSEIFYDGLLKILITQ